MKNKKFIHYFIKNINYNKNINKRINKLKIY